MQPPPHLQHTSSQVRVVGVLEVEHERPKLGLVLLRQAACECTPEGTHPPLRQVKTRQHQEWPGLGFEHWWKLVSDVGMEA